MSGPTKLPVPDPPLADGVVFSLLPDEFEPLADPEQGV
jgi:hypothetical protein